jgi:iron complex transport system substrate-binding protein
MVAITASRLPMSPPWVAGPKSYLAKLVELAGHHPVPDDMGAEYGEISIEYVLRTNPDVIVEIRGLAGEPKDVSADARSAWGTLGELNAVRSGRVFVLQGAQHVIPGPRCVDTLEELARLLGR